MPGGAASLVGNLYFTSWSALFSVVATNLWWVKDWRQGIQDVLLMQQREYDEIKRTLRNRALRQRELRLAQSSDASSSGVVLDGTNGPCTSSRVLFSGTIDTIEE